MVAFQTMRSLAPSRFAALALVLAFAGTAFAQAPAPAPAPPATAAPPAPAAAPAAPTGAAPAPAAPAAAAPAAPAPVAPPPVAARGPSPYGALVNKGDGFYLSRDFEGAIGAYREELQKNPSSPLTHYRLGAAQLAKGDTKEAELSWQNALRFAGTDEKLKSKILFVLADLRERLKAHEDAVIRWKEYQAHAQAQPAVKTFPATAVERIKRVDEWKKISADSAEVKARIEKRVQEAEESLRKSSK